MASAAIVLVIIAAVFICITFSERQLCLVLENSYTDKQLLALPVEEGDIFSVTFVHSVNNTPVTDYYEIRGEDFYVVQTKYYGFGAGVQTEIGPGQQLTYTDDGAMLVSGFNQKMTGMIYVVGMVSDHTLELNGSKYSLRNICARGTSVRFTLKRLRI